MAGLRNAALAAFLLAVLPAAAAARDSVLTVAAAANVQFALEEIRAVFVNSTGIGVKAVYGASGKLTTQIRNGAPFDVFVSADMEYPDSLHRWGHAVAKPRPYAYGRLVLWTLREADQSRGLEWLRHPSIRKVAVADPKRAPYGREAIKALQRAGLYDAVMPKLVFGENIAQVSQFLMTGNVDAAFNAKSVVLAPETRGKGAWREVDSTLYDRIAQGAVICKHGQANHPGLSGRFHDFLYSEASRKIFLRYGYEPP